MASCEIDGCNSIHVKEPDPRHQWLIHSPISLHGIQSLGSCQLHCAVDVQLRLLMGQEPDYVERAFLANIIMQKTTTDQRNNFSFMLLDD